MLLGIYLCLTSEFEESIYIYNFSGLVSTYYHVIMYIGIYELFIQSIGVFLMREFLLLNHMFGSFRLFTSLFI